MLQTSFTGSFDIHSMICVKYFMYCVREVVVVHRKLIDKAERKYQEVCEESTFQPQPSVCVCVLKQD